MMRRCFAVLFLILAAATVVEAQGGARLGVRSRGRGGSDPTPQQGITITNPATATVQTTAPVIELAGTFTPEIASIAWANALTGGNGSGVLDVTSGTYTVTLSASAVKFHDDFTRVSSITVASHTPTIAGDAWLALRSDNGNTCEVRSSDYLQPSVSDATGGRVVACELDPTGTISGTNYNFRATLGATASFSSSNNFALLFSITDETEGSEDWCGVEFLAGSQNPDVRLFKTVNGVPTTLDSLDGFGLAVGQVLELRARGDTFTFWQDVTQRLTATDAACNQSKRTAIAFGDVYPGSGKTIAASARVDDVVLEDADGGSPGIPLNNGENVITVTGCKADMVTCYPRMVRVTRGASDTTPPFGTVETPTSQLSYTTDQGTITWTGTATDIGGSVSSVVVASGTMGVSPASITATLVGNTWSAGPFAIPTEDSTWSFTITDTALLTTVLPARVVTRSAAADTTAPTITITLPNGSGSSTTSSSTVSLSGTAADTGGSGLAATGAISWTSSGCGGGAATGSTSWTIPAIDLTGASPCTVSVRATDIAGNPSTVATHVFTFNQPLFINSPTSLTAIEGQAFTFCPTFGGGTGPYTLSKPTGTYPTPSSPVFSINASNCVVGTPSAGSAGSYTGWSLRITDNTAAQATTATFTFTVGTGTLGGQNNTHFNTVTSRTPFASGGDMWRSYPMRSVEQIEAATGSARYVTGFHGNPAWSYNPATDTDPQRQDAAKFTLRTWIPLNILAADLSGASVAGSIDTVLTTTNWNGQTNGIVIRIDNEILTCLGVNSTTNCLPNGANANNGTFSRGNWGTTVAAHTAGAQIWALQTKLGVPQQAYWDVGVSTTSSDRYLVSFEFYLPDAWQALGQNPNSFTDCGGIFFGPNPTPYNVSAYCARPWGGFKAFQFRTNGSGDGITWEWKVNTSLADAYASVIPPGFNATTGTDVGASSLRLYSPVGTTHMGLDPTRPVANTWAYKAGRWNRFWAFIELNHDQNAAAFEDFAPLSAAITTTTETTISIDYTGFPPAPPPGDGVGSSVAQVLWSANDNTGRRMRIGTEVMSIGPCTVTGNPRTCTAVRGVDGSTPATHSAGAMTQLMWDYITTIASDEVNNPITTMAKVPVTRRRHNANTPGIVKFNWEMDDSNQRAVGFLINNGWNDVHGYVKNVYVLRKSGTGGAGGGDIPAEWTAIFEKPTVNGN